MQKNCKQCEQNFEITDEDLKFYDKISPQINGQKFLIPSPALCPSCRSQRRLSFRNELNLYQRKCNFSGKTIISMYSSDKPYKIYDQDIWWSDKWDPMEFGMDFDFNKPFFEQYKELQKQVPRMSLNVIKAENSYYTNYAFGNKNSYLVFTADNNESSYFGRFSDRNFNCMDFDFTYDSTGSYQILEMHNCTNCFYSQNCHDSSDLYFCNEMRNCHNCIGCANLRNKEFYIFNKQVSKDEFNEFKQGLKLTSYLGVQASLNKMNDFLITQPHKNLQLSNCENCIGDHLLNSKNAINSYNGYGLQDVKYTNFTYNIKDCYDWDFVGLSSELCYEMVSSGINLYNCLFTMNSWENNSNLLYSELCLGNKNLFGCIGLRKKEYCILNKQYTKEEYERLIPKIIEHMRKTGEWGEFFPLKLSPFGYNESVASETMPLSKEEAESAGANWKEKDLLNKYEGVIAEIPDDIKDFNDELLKQIFVCKDCGENYKMIPQELEFYKKVGVAAPRKCFKCRHKERMALRNPRKLWDRTCTKCGVSIKTSYAPERPEKVYCEGCYLKEVY